MSRYSPTVLPTYTNPFAEALASGLDAFESTRKRRATEAAQSGQAARDAERLGLERTRTAADLYTRGFRDPADLPVTTTPAAPTAFTTSLAGAPAVPETPSLVPTGDQLAAALRENLPPAAQSGVSAALRGASPVIGRGGRFDPNTGTFGGGAPSPMAQMIGQAVATKLRGGPLGNGLIFDPTQTPEALAETRRQTAAQEQEKRRVAAQQQAEITQQQRDYRTLAAIEPEHVAVKDRPFDPSGHLNYTTLLADALKRQEQRESAKATAGSHVVTLTHPNTVNVLDGTIEDVYSDGTRKTVRKATPDEIRKATYVAPPPGDTYTPYPGVDPVTKQPVVRPFDTKTGKFGPPADVLPKGAGTPATKALAAPIAAKVGQFGEMLKKSDDLFSAMDSMDVSILGSGAADIAEHGIGHIPGTRGVGSYLLNKNPAYAQYQAALEPFVLAAAHALSGARINEDQTKKIKNSVEMKPGDFANPKVRGQKLKNLLDLLNSIGGSLPADAIIEQENQMDDAAKERLRERGYLSRGASEAAKAAKATPGAPASSGNIDLNQQTETEWAAANPPLPGESFDAYHARYRASVRKP